VEKMNILIFGGTKGIGKEIADYLRPNNVVYVCSKTASVVQDENGFQSLPCDITKEEDISSVILTMLLRRGKIDVVINSAGIVLMKPFLDYTSEDMDLIFNTNIKGACLISKAIIPLFKKQKGGRIIHLGSTRSFTVAPNKSIYAMSKFALRALNKSINLEFNKKRIYSSMVCPGRVDITGTDPQLVSPKDIIKAVEKIISLPNNMNVEEIIIGGVL
jgi:NAD(P)-dependent dehydrogenase (short-subunit alcohol dehydrogenase family)